MSSPRLTVTRSLSGTGQGPTAGEVLAFLKELPEDTIVRIDLSRGNQMDPRQWTLTVTQR